MAVIATTDAREQELAEYFAPLASKAAAAASARTQDKPEDTDSVQRDRVRQSLLPRSDEHAKERVVGFRDIVPLSFMERGLRAGSSVCRAERVKHRVSVFTGPIFETSDPDYGADRPGGPWQLPKYFWKVVVYMRDHGDPAVAAFRMDQTDYVTPLFERYTPLSEAEARTYQEPLTKIERWTGLSFPALRAHDRFGGTESRGRPRLIRKLSDITL